MIYRLPNKKITSAFGLLFVRWKIRDQTDLCVVSVVHDVVVVEKEQRLRIASLDLLEDLRRDVDVPGFLLVEVSV